MNFQTIVLVGGWESMNSHPILDFGFWILDFGFWIDSTDKSAIFSDFGF
jgi:acetyl-CoA acetyltransferase